MIKITVMRKQNDGMSAREQAAMNKDQALNLIPDNQSLFSMTAVEKKHIAAEVIKEIINQIETENRNPTEWEIESLSYAFGLMLSGLYVAAIDEAILCFSGKDEVARPEHWWNEAQNITAQDLRVSLAHV